MGRTTESEDLLENGRVAYRDWSWNEAFQSFKAVEEIEPLAPADYELLATTSFMLGNVSGMIDAQEKAYRGYLDEGLPLPAARVALSVAAGMASRGKLAQAGGWVERGNRLLEAVDEPCMEEGYRLLPQAIGLTIDGDFESAVRIAADAARIGRQFEYPDLIALAAHAQARALLAWGKSAEGFRLLDEVMLSIIAGDCSPMVTGIVYCSVLEGCYETHEVRRATVWTNSLAEWCGAQADLVAFTDQCLAHRSELLRLQGDWAEALSEARRSHQNNSRGPVAAQAHYLQAEIYRMRGEFKRAELEYQETALKGGESQPGLALLQQRMGNEDAAVASIRRALLETQGLLPRIRILPGCVEVLLETGHLNDAADAMAELATIAEQTSIDSHRGWSKYCSGVLALAHSSPVEAASDLRDALRIWEDLQLPYELARTRRELGRALSLMGDDGGARVQWEAAGVAFKDLGARPDADETARMLSSGGLEKPFGLTDREVEVLAKLASGATNRAIAVELVVSERTIDRHVSNIFTKLGVNTRSAATAAAIRNDIA